MKRLSQKSSVWCAVALLVGLAVPANAQSASTVQVQVHEARLAIPFGEVSGKLVQVGDYLIFLDEDQPNQSFAITRTDIRNLSGQDDVISVELTQPVRDRSGERSRLSFRLDDRSEVPVFTAWAANARASGAGNMTSTTNQPSSAPANSGNDSSILASYSVQHDHRIGHCSGRLIIRQNMVAYESIDEINDSRQWALRDVKELKLDNPYELNVKPFSGDEYNFSFQGKAMDTDVYRELVSRVTAARSE